MDAESFTGSMSCGLFDLLPEDIYQVLWFHLDPEGLALVAQLNRSLRDRTKDEIYWQRQVQKLVDFNTIMTPENAKFDLKAAKDENANNRRLFSGFLSVVEAALERYKRLEASGELKPFAEYRDSLKQDGRFHDGFFWRSGPKTWKHVFAAVAFALDKKRMSTIEFAVSQLEQIIEEGDPQKSAFALKTMLACQLRSQDLHKLNHKIKRCNPAVAPIIWEYAAFGIDEYSRHLCCSLLAKIKDPVALFWILEQEFNPWNREEREVGGLHRSTCAYFQKLEPATVLQAMLEGVGALDLVTPTDTTLPLKLLKVLLARERTEITPLIRAACVHLLFLAKHGDFIISDALCVEDDSADVEDAIVRTIEALRGQETVDKLIATVNDEKKLPRGRLRAAFLLKRLGYDIEKLHLHKLKIPGFPRPWVGPKLPTAMRHAILRQYAKDAEKGSDVALLLEAELLGPSDYEDYEQIKTTSEMFNGIEVIGPYSAGDLHMQGGGTYNVYKVYVDSSDVGFQPPEGSIVYSTAVVCTCTFAPYAYVSRNSGTITSRGASGSLYIERQKDVEKYSEGVQLPTYEEVKPILEAWADHYGYEIVPDALLDTRFDGLNVYFFGDRSPLQIRDLLFYWQD
eukprot:TRINITY_DN8463_c0_g1_i1.p1 TRINITY_DN8463_c0_g1~~TRINITY_DN8463_c0_g1_i1.p1  ORF type:complete len:625 (-),score=94.94 TRINITY_DN8463_c0_g1_i1:44-1918(-)